MSKKLLSQLKSPDPDQRYKAILSVENDSPKEIANEVYNLIYNDKDSDCIELAIEQLPGLKSLSRAKKIPAILEGLKKRNVSVKQASVKALRILKAKEYQGELLSILKETKNEILKVEIIEALEEFGDRATSKILKKLLDDKSYLVRRYAVLALSQILQEEVIPTLKRALKKERSKYVRSYMLSKLVSLGERDYLDELVSLLRSKQYIVRGTTAGSLGGVSTKRNGKAILVELEKAISRERVPYSRQMMEESIETIKKILK